MTQANSRSHAELQDQLRFESLLAGLSSKFINVPTDQVDAIIEEAQRRFCEWLGIDLCVLWQWEFDAPGIFTLTHYYRRVHGPPISRQLRASEHFPWGLREVQAGRSFLISSMDDVPAGAERDQETLCHFGVKAVVLLPLSTGGGSPFGAVSFSDMVAPRTWSEPLVKRLELIAQLFANAILRKRSDQALRESQERLTLAVAAANAGFWALNRIGTSFWTNPEIMAIFGLSPAGELTVDRFIALVHPEDRQLVRETLAQAQTSSGLSAIEYRIVRPDGSIRWVSSRGRLCAGGSEEAARLMGITSDITERKQREEALLASEARIASAVDVAGLGFYESGENGGVQYMDDRIRELLGLPPSEKPGSRDYWLAHIHPEDHPRVLEVSRRLLDGELDQYSLEYRFMHPFHGLTWFHHLSRVLARNTAGRATRLIGVLQDITDRKRLEEDMADQLRFERLLADVSTRFVSVPSHKLDLEIEWVLRQMLVFYHADRCTLWRISFEKNMVKAIGLIREESMQPLPSDIDMVGLFSWSIDTLVAKREPIVVNSLDELPPEAQMDRKNYQALGIQSILLIPVFIGEALAFIISVSSVTCERIWPEHCIPRLRLLTEALANALMRKRAEEELRESCEAFQSLAGRLLSAQEEEHRLLARELHDDLSQRLAIISIGIGKLERLSGSLPDEVVARLKEIRERVVDLSSDVHDISRQLHPSIIEDLGLNRAIQSECAHFTQREGIRARYRSKDVPAAIPIDTAVCLFRVVQEGLRNIAKHAKVRESDVSLTGADDRILLTIQDAGVGFDVNQPAGRPALGLTSMKERIHLIRGEFLIESTLGKGTTITVVAPLSGMQK